MSDPSSLPPKRLKGIEEFDQPLWQPPRPKEPFPWRFAAICGFMGVSFGLAFAFWL